MRFLVRNWLWRNRIFHMGIVFCDNDVPDSKRDACLRQQIKEDTAITRSASNTLLDWAERSVRKMGAPLLRKHG